MGNQAEELILKWGQDKTWEYNLSLRVNFNKSLKICLQMKTRIE
jgi:hypothetical protein